MGKTSGKDQKTKKQSKKPDSSIYRMIHKLTRESIWIEDHRQFLFDESDKLIGIFGAARNITERIHAEESLRESEKRFKLLFDNAPLSYQSLDNNGCFIDVNSTWLSSLGYSREEVIGHFFGEFMTPDSAELIKTRFPKFVEAGEGHDYQFEMKKKDGSTIWASYEGKIAFDHAGKFKQTHCIFTDITESKKATEALKESEERYKKLIDTIPNGVAVYQDGKFVLVNSAGLKHMNLSSEDDIIGKLVLSIVHPDCQYDVINRMHQVAQGKYVEPFEEKIIRFDGSIFDAEVSATGIIYKGKPAGLVVLQDITERKKAENEVRLLAEQFKLLTSTSIAGFWKVNSDGKFIFVNDTYSEMIGYSRDELLNMFISDVEASETPEETKKHIEYLIKTGFHRFESQHKCKDGKIIDVEVSASFSKDLQQILVFLYDITDQKINEKQLRLSNLRYETLFTKAGEGIVTLSTKGDVISVNESFAEMHGFKIDELINTNINKINTPESSKLFKERLHRILEGESLNFEVEHYCKDGKIIEVEISATLIQIGDEKVIQAFNRNITDRKIAEKEIHKLSTAIEQSHLSIIITDKDANIEYVNPYFSEVTGYTREEAINQNPRVLKSGETPAEKYHEMWNILTSGKSWAGLFHNKKKNGKLFWESAIITPIKDESGIITNYIAVKEDITEKILAEIELKKYREHLEELVESRTEELDRMNADLMEQLERQKELEMMLRQSLGKEKELNELKTRFISTTSHEFRTPLTSVLSSAELIERYGKKWGPEKINEHIGRIKSSVDYVTKLLDEVLTISRVESGKITFEPELVDLYEFCSQIVNDVKSIYREERGFIFNFQPDEKDFNIDRKLLKFILTNLLSNAFKYTPQNGKIKFSIIKEENYLIFEVSDEGIGIPENDKQHLFEPFFRCSNSGEISGTGLGLSIVKQSVELHKGEINVNSKLGEGSVFTVKFKL